MIKPAKFSDLPSILQKSLLWDIDLDYDSYESSKAECIHMIQCSPQNYLSSTNRAIIENAYKFMTDDFLLGRAKFLLKHEEIKVATLRNFIYETRR